MRRWGDRKVEETVIDKGLTRTLIQLTVVMDRGFIYNDLGEFGFNQFHVKHNDKWVWLDLEVDCDTITATNFNSNDNLIFQFWLNHEETRFNMASKFKGHRRQVEIPLPMLAKLKATFTAPAKGGAEFDLSIDNEKYRGEIVRGEVDVSRSNEGKWDMQNYWEKRGKFEVIVKSIVNMTRGELTRVIEYINA